MEQFEASLFVEQNNELGESACWWPDRACWCWVDILGKVLYIYPPDGYTQSFPMPAFVSAIAPVAGGEELLLGLQDRVVRFSPERGIIDTLAVIDARPHMRCNDGRCDPDGRLWIGTMALDAADGAGTLYTIQAVNRLETGLKQGVSPYPRLQGVSVSNGIVWQQQRMYYNDSHTRCVQEFAYDAASGDITFIRRAIEIPQWMGLPDGMCADEQGRLWIAHWGGAAVYCWDPLTAQVAAKVSVPALQVSSCMFGGAGMNELLITTAREHLSPEELAQYPLSGSVFKITLPVKGLTVNYFKL
ncbi:SMP-30/gluconolactonase/LRE family protein [Chitinophaga vietnamensis]|uniref:SMP-30/gluconolactonase/LRE family protein n=1 Tax=Chitinophaga vietnamensis TaxID=2593957 RepID=UPI0013764876|nr:SMP-30/gluconolactonase/LRE family protein [Chitinophaga vietnamensis]